jgi:hypothetical protein
VENRARQQWWGEGNEVGKEMRLTHRVAGKEEKRARGARLTRSWWRGAACGITRRPVAAAQ